MKNLSLGNGISRNQILSIMKKFNIEGHISGNEYVGKCPFHEDLNPSFSINLHTGLWICFAENKSGNFFQLLQVLTNDFKTLLIPRNDEIDFDLDIQLEEEEQQELPEVFCPFDLENFPLWIMDRGFNRTTITKWEFGKNPSSGSLIILIRDANGRLVGWTCRQAKNRKPKYIDMKGLKKSRLLFGEYFLKDSPEFLCITEGELNTIWLDQHGFPSVALMSSHMSKIQERRLVNLNAKEFVMCLDNDEAGKMAANSIGKRLSKYALVSYISLPEEKNDIQDIRKKVDVIGIIESRTCF